VSWYYDNIKHFCDDECESAWKDKEERRIAAIQRAETEEHDSCCGCEKCISNRIEEKHSNLVNYKKLI